MKANSYLTYAMKATLEDYPNIDQTIIDRCPACDGAGEIQPDNTCKKCEGTGIKDHEYLELSDKKDDSLFQSFISEVTHAGKENDDAMNELQKLVTKSTS